MRGFFQPQISDMYKKKTDEQLRNEISARSQDIIDFLDVSRNIQKIALQSAYTFEHLEMMQRFINKQKQAIDEMKKTNRLQKILLNRQRKMLRNQQNYLKDEFQTLANSNLERRAG